MKETCLISACLLGVDCRYDGGNNGLAPGIIQELKNKYYLVPVCPEQMGGLSTPRLPSEIQPDGSLKDPEGRNVTDNFIRGAEAACRIAGIFGAELALLKANSPSCGNRRVYDGRFNGTLVEGKGVTARMLEKAGISVFSEKEIDEVINI